MTMIPIWQVALGAIAAFIYHKYIVTSLNNDNAQLQNEAEASKRALDAMPKEFKTQYINELNEQKTHFENVSGDAVVGSQIK